MKNLWINISSTEPSVQSSRLNKEKRKIRAVSLSEVQLDCFSACVCIFPFPTSVPLKIRSARLPAASHKLNVDVFVENSANTKRRFSSFLIF